MISLHQGKHVGAIDKISISSPKVYDGNLASLITS